MSLHFVATRDPKTILSSRAPVVGSTSGTWHLSPAAVRRATSKLHNVNRVKSDTFSYSTEALAQSEMKTLDFFRSCGPGRGQRWYYSGAVAADMQTLGPKIQTSYSTIANFQLQGDINVWMGCSNVRTRAHYDDVDNVFVQHHGRKRVRLWSPTDAECMSILPNYHSSARQAVNSSPSGSGRSEGAVSVCRGAGTPVVDTVLSPGDFVYIPPFWLHEMTTEVASGGAWPYVSISTSLWLDIVEVHRMQAIAARPLPFQQHWAQPRLDAAVQDFLRELLRAAAATIPTACASAWSHRLHRASAPAWWEALAANQPAPALGESQRPTLRLIARTLLSRQIGFMQRHLVLSDSDVPVAPTPPSAASVLAENGVCGDSQLRVTGLWTLLTVTHNSSNPSDGSTDMSVSLCVDVSTSQKVRVVHTNSGAHGEGGQFEASAAAAAAEFQGFLRPEIHQGVDADGTWVPGRPDGCGLAESSFGVWLLRLASYVEQVADWASGGNDLDVTARMMHLIAGLFADSEIGQPKAERVGT